MALLFFVWRVPINVYSFTRIIKPEKGRLWNALTLNLSREITFVKLTREAVHYDVILRRVRVTTLAV